MGGKQEKKASRVLQTALMCSALGASGTFVGMATAGASARPHAGATVTLRFWNAYNETDKEASTMEHVIIPKFEKENPGIKVINTTLPYSGLLDKYIAASAAGNPPDLIRSDIAWVPQLAAEGVAMKLSGQAWFNAIKKTALPGPLSTNKFRASYYGIPDDTNTQVLFWNKTDFTAAGISGPPTTMTQFFSDVQKLTDNSKSQYGLGIDGTDVWNVSPYVWSYGGEFTNTKLTQANGYMNGNATRQILGKLVGLYKAGDIGSNFLGGAGAVSGETGFPKGEYAMYIDGPWAVPTYKAMNPQPNYGTALIPKGAGGSVSVVGGEDLVLSAGGKHIADTVKFAQFLASPFAQLAMANQGDLAGYSTDSAAEVKQQPYLKIFVQQLKTAKARPVTAGYSTLDTDFSNELQEALAGKATIPYALNTAAAAATTALLANL